MEQGTNCFLYGDGGTNFAQTPVVDATAIAATNRDVMAAKDSGSSNNGNDQEQA